MENKFNQAKIYSIQCLNSDKMYIGSTCKKYLNSRFSQHKYNFKKWMENKYNYCSVFDVLCTDAYITLLEEVNVNTAEEMHEIEKRYIQQYRDRFVNRYYIK